MIDTRIKVVQDNNNNSINLPLRLLGAFGTTDSPHMIDVFMCITAIKNSGLPADETRSLPGVL